MIGLARMILAQAKMKCGYSRPVSRILSKEHAKRFFYGIPIYPISHMYYVIVDQINNGTWKP